ncbi:ATP-grasp domain-containing protein [Pseudodesulfovibrio sp. zrk46]|uniref:ATP-grasp domain-containing protein n=1 Tax=Pseudodesulfovibrio sp. zrk46 TaxID=2725288 RepID=UPI001448D6A4|nr:ATP-grasp domain-containing protein [Pseudodesulfovibrio sp. zrk46]QJB55857.1 ATP-grasp domain-containing protein [Pseudodesulfovibrio sp. zrk46]
MNVLITSAGRRTSLLAHFKDAAGRRGGKVFAGDMDGLAPALYLADESVQLPRVTTDEYIPFLLDYVKQHDIKLVVPTIDTELAVFAANAAQFAELGCRLLISSPELVGACRDKWNTSLVFEKKGVRVPYSWLPEEALKKDLPEKLFVKPRDGSASQDAYPVERKDLEVMLTQVPNAIVQERVEGREITIDALIDFDGNPIHYVPRIRVKTVGGESVQGLTIKEPGLGEWLESLLKIIGEMGGIGPMTLQAFLTGDEYVLFEINPRFGGGFPLGHAAGGHYPEWLMQMVEGENVAPKLGEYTEGMAMTRSYTEVFTTEPKW